MDVDGTLTDGKIYISENGELFKAFHVKDGYGICNILPQNQIEPVIITGRKSKIVEKRAAELNIRFLFQGISDKKKTLDSFLRQKSETDHCNYSYENCSFIGDDIPDLSCMMVIKKAGGMIFCPADATQIVKETADFISQYPAGEGAVREAIDYLITLR